ncbi:MAG: hypothetical protein ACE5G8_02740 [Anaerolineae bacterium]
MDISFKFKLTGFLSVLLLATLACSVNLPFGIGFNAPDEGEVARALTVTSSPTDTPTATPTNTATPTSTPVPTPTATRVVLPTDTPTAVIGASQASAELGGDPTKIAAATATAQMTATVTLPPPPPPVAGTAEVLVNGNFEAGWPDWQPVATGWTPFDNGQAHQSWYKDTWSKVVFDGTQAQMIEIVSDGGVGDRYAGIYQTVPVVAGAEYELIIHGLVRSDEGSEGLSGGGYSLQYGLDFNGGDDWQAVTDWVSLPFPEHPREDPNADNVYNYGTYSVKFRPKGKTLTLFLRAWKKWADFNEGNFDVDGLSLRGTGAQATVTPTPTPTPAVVEATPTVPPTDTATPLPPTNTPTPLPEMPDSGGQIQNQTPVSLLVATGVTLILVLLSGAMWGIVKRRVG